MLAAGMLVCMLTAVTISINASKHAIREAEIQEEIRSQESRRAACLVIITQHEVYTDPVSPPATATGKNAAEAWGNLRRAFRCDEG